MIDETLADHACPDAGELRALLEETLVPDIRDQIELHVSGCAACQARLDQLTEGTDIIPAGAGDLAAETPSPGLQQALDRLADAAALATDVSDPTDGDVSNPVRPLNRDFEFLESTSDSGLLGLLDGYEVIDVVGRGGMGIVFSARDPSLERLVAIKVLAPHMAASETSRRRFLREARSAASVEHEGVVTIHAVGETRELPYLVMQFISGRSLQAKLEAEGRLKIRTVIRIGRETAAALQAAHDQGLIHRDVKPANILLDRRTGAVRLTDFGLARTVDTTLTRTGVVAGTPAFMSPEQASGAELDHRSDLFSLGSVMYTMATGEPPFAGDSPVAVAQAVCTADPVPVQHRNPRIPNALADVIERLLERDPDDRFQSAAEVEQALAEDAVTQVLPAIPELPAVQPVHPVRSRGRSQADRRLFVGSGIGISLMCLIGLLWSLGVFSREPGVPPDDTKQSLGQSGGPAGEAGSGRGALPLPRVARGLPPQLEGFVVIKADGSWRQTANLESAIELAASHDGIEVHGQRAFDCLPVVIDQPLLTLRAGEGSLPVLMFRNFAAELGGPLDRPGPPGPLGRPGPRAFNADQPLIESNGCLVLEGLEIVSLLPDDPGRRIHTMVRANNRLFAANCRFQLAKSRDNAVGSCVTVMDAMECELRNCELFCGVGDSAVTWFAEADAHVRLINCGLEAPVGINAHYGMNRVIRDARAELDRCTVSGVNAVRAVFDSVMPPGRQAGRIEMQMRRCVVAVDAMLEIRFNPSLREVIATEERVRRNLPRAFRWQDDANVLDVRRSYVQWVYPNGQVGDLSNGPLQLADWYRFWQLPPHNSIEAEVIFARPPGPARRPQRPISDNFRVIDLPRFGTLDRPGMDLRISGPPGWFQWRQSGEYREWIGRILRDQTLAGPPAAPPEGRPAMWPDPAVR